MRRNSYYSQIIVQDSKENLLNSFDYKKLEISYELNGADLAKLEQTLKQNISNFHYKLTNDLIEVKYKVGIANLGEVISAIASSGIIIKDVISHMPRLEDVFRKMIPFSS
jgi:hypothetical protein